MPPDSPSPPTPATPRSATARALTRARALEIAREVIDGKARGYVAAAHHLAQFLLDEEAARQTKTVFVSNAPAGPEFHPPPLSHEQIGKWFTATFACRISNISPIQVRPGMALIGSRLYIFDDRHKPALEAAGLLGKQTPPRVPTIDLAPVSAAVDRVLSLAELNAELSIPSNKPDPFPSVDSEAPEGQRRPTIPASPPPPSPGDTLAPVAVDYQPGDFIDRVGSVRPIEAEDLRDVQQWEHGYESEYVPFVLQRAPSERPDPYVKKDTESPPSFSRRATPLSVQSVVPHPPDPSSTRVLSLPEADATLADLNAPVQGTIAQAQAAESPTGVRKKTVRKCNRGTERCPIRHEPGVTSVCSPLKYAGYSYKEPAPRYEPEGDE